MNCNRLYADRGSEEERVRKTAKHRPLRGVNRKQHIALPRGWWTQRRASWEKWSFEIAPRCLVTVYMQPPAFLSGKSSFFFCSLPIFPQPPKRDCLHVEERVYHCAHGLGRLVYSSENLEAVTQSKQGPEFIAQVTGLVIEKALLTGDHSFLPTDPECLYR